MINKKCDLCSKDIESKEGDYPWSEWCLYHHKKRRDFCSNKCLKSFVNGYVTEKNNFKYIFEMFEKRCREIADFIISHTEIKDIYGVPRGGLIPAVRLS